MRVSTELLIAASIGAAMAGPTHHHLHRNVHAKKALEDVDWKALDWDNMGINWSSAWAAGQSTTATAATPSHTDAPIIAAAKVTTTAKAVEATPTTAAAAKTSAASIVSDLKTLFSSIEGLANDIKAFGTAVTSSSGVEVSYIGNIGSPQGYNMMKVDSPTGYDFTNTFENTSGETITIVVWNKAYSRTGKVADAEANLGSCLALSSPALSFTIAAGGKQTVAFQENSQVGWAQATSVKTASGAPGTAWGEANFVSTGCGYDVSSIVNPKGNTYDMAISSNETPCISDMTQNNWIAGPGGENDPVPVGDSNGSCYIPGGKATMVTKMGGDKA